MSDIFPSPLHAKVPRVPLLWSSATLLTEGNLQIIAVCFSCISVAATVLLNIQQEIQDFHIMAVLERDRLTHAPVLFFFFGPYQPVRQKQWLTISPLERVKDSTFLWELFVLISVGCFFIFVQNIFLNLARIGRGMSASRKGQSDISVCITVLLPWVKRQRSSSCIV